MPDPILPVRVTRREAEAEGILAFELRHADGVELPAFTAGAHINVRLPNGLIRSYSLHNDPVERHRYCIAVLREPASRGGSAALHDQVRVGDLLKVSAPKNHFPLVTEARHTRLLAGGIGITPLLAMAEALHAAGAPFELHYCARSAARMAFADRLRGAAYAACVHLHLDDGARDQRFDIGQTLASPAPGHHVYVCGPKGLLDRVRSTAALLGWQDAQVHFEYFASGEMHSDRDDAFELVLQRSGRVIHVAAGQTVVDALLACGVPVPVSCQQGVCGTCLTNVLDGEVEHKDLYLSAEERQTNRVFLPCCSRARSPRLVVDL